jgi:DNA transposition AAA+ family ATPase
MDTRSFNKRAQPNAANATPDKDDNVKGKLRRVTRGDWIVWRLTGSRRLLIVDNAHKATLAAIRGFFDFYDATGCPVALVGNPELMDLIVNSDQRFSRVGIREDLSIANPERLVKHMIAKVAPDSGEALIEACVKVASNQGHYRAVGKQLSLAAKMIDGALAQGDLHLTGWLLLWLYRHPSTRAAPAAP